jgi:hypothetical protein
MPWPALHWMAAGALALRLVVALWSERISYPDELFQYLEPAHRLVYGYGFVTWEYRFGIRNWLLPGFLAVLLQGLRSVSIEEPSVYIPLLKCVFAVLSVAVVYASYAIGRNVFCELTGRIAAIFAVVWYELLYSSTLPTPEVLGGYTFLVAIALWTGSPSKLRAVVLGLLLGLSVALRFHYSVPAAALGVLILANWGWRSGLRVSISGALVLGLAGLLDAWTWGIPFVSFYNSVVFNVLHGVANVFGTKPLLWYPYKLTQFSAGLHLIAIVCGVLNWQRSWPILLLIACVVVPHSLIAHKEYRFIFLAIPLFLILLANGTVQAMSWLRSLRSMQAAAIAIVIVVSTVGCVLGGVMRRDDRLLASLELSQRKDVAALLDLTGHWTQSGAYYYLHRNVPYYFRPNVSEVPASEYRFIASHILVAEPTTLPVGFHILARYGSVAILGQAEPPETYRKLEKDGSKPQQEGVDDRLAPTVRARY